MRKVGKIRNSPLVSHNPWSGETEGSEQRSCPALLPARDSSPSAGFRICFGITPGKAGAPRGSLTW